MQSMDVLFQCYTFNNTSRISNALVKRYLYSSNVIHFLAHCEFTFKYTTVFLKKKIQLFKILNKEINME